MTIAVISMIRDSWGGSEELWYDMAKCALKDGHKIIHLRYETPDVHPKIKELITMGLISLTRPGYVPQKASKSSKLLHLGKNFLLKQVDSSFQKIITYKPDVIIYNGTCYSIASEKTLQNILLRNEYGNISFYIIGHLNNDLKRDISDTEAEKIRLMYSKSKTVFFVSQRNKETAERHLCTTISNAAIIKNPVNMNDVSYIPFPTTSNIYNFALVGNLVTIHKGQDILLQSLSNDEWKKRNWHLNIYGAGYDEHYLKQLVKYYSLTEKVSFHGKVADIRNLWSQNHILLMPSHMEGMPLAVVEAMLCGRPCLATDVGGHSEWIEDNENGFIVFGNNVHAINKALNGAWSKRTEWELMGKKALEKASALYEKDAGKKLLDLISNIK